MNISTLAALEERLRVMPKETLLRDIARAEGLAEQVEDDGTYPEDWVVFRVTGTRPDVKEPAMIVGAALKADLSSLVERLCDAGRLCSSDFEPNTLIDADALCRRWRMSRQTLSRLRRRGLVARRVLGETGKPRLMFSLEAVDRFAEKNREAVARSAEYSRMGPEVEARVVKRAARYKRLLGLSLNAAAARIAERFGRSHEAIRQVLKRYERAAAKPVLVGAGANGRSGVFAMVNGNGGSGNSGIYPALGLPPGPIFNEAAPLTEERREAVFRAWRLGIDPRVICKTYRRSRAAARRAVNVARANRLTELLRRGALTHAVPIEPPKNSVRAKLTAKAEQARGSLTRRKPELSPLDQVPANAGLGVGVPRTINDLIALGRANTPPIGVEERARLAAYQHLRTRAAELTFGLDRLFPAAITLDQIETYLRWAARLKVELVRSQFRLIVETLEGRFERKLEDVPRSKMPRLLMDAVRTVGEVIDGVDPSHAGRLAAPVGLALDKLAVRWIKDLAPVTLPPGTRLRASPLLPNAPDVEDWSRTIAPWQRWLEPHFRTRDAVEKGLVPEVERDFLSRRFGWYGGPPRTLSELGDAFGLSPIRVVVFEQRALRGARLVWRATQGR